MKDRFGRTIEYMRVSITDRCNLRCRYCMPDGCEKLDMSEILTYEEIEQICRAAAELGISRIKITGGEPLVRLGCMELIRRIKALPGIEEVTLTTNGQLLEKYLDELTEIGIDGINISLDTLDPERFSYMTGGGELAKTMRAVEACSAAGIRTKVNCLLQRSFNDDEITEIASLAFKYGIDVRFIEMMPIGEGVYFDSASGSEVLDELMAEWPNLEPDNERHGNGPAVYFKRPGIKGGIGFISALSDEFCGACNRIRLTSTGELKPCLCYESGRDLKPFLPGAETDNSGLKGAIYDTVTEKPKAHCFSEARMNGGRDRLSRMESRSMSQIGG